MKERKSFTIGKLEVMNAYNKVRSNKGGGGVDQMSLQDFELDKANHLYKLWNQMSSGSYMPCAVKLVEIPKKGGGKRPLGIPTIVDRVGQTVVKALLEKEMDKIFHEDRYGYRPNKSAHQAIEQAGKRCWKFDWVIESMKTTVSSTFLAIHSGQDKPNIAVVRKLSATGCPQ